MNSPKLSPWFYIPILAGIGLTPFVAFAGKNTILLYGFIGLIAIPVWYMRLKHWKRGGLVSGKHPTVPAEFLLGKYFFSKNVPSGRKIWLILIAIIVAAISIFGSAWFFTYTLKI